LCWQRYFCFLRVDSFALRWLGHHSNAHQDLINLAIFLAPEQDMSISDSWKAKAESGTRPSKPPSTLTSPVLPPLSILFESSLLLMTPTLQAALKPMTGLKPRWAVVIPMQVVQVPVQMMLMMAIFPALKLLAAAAAANIQSLMVLIVALTMLVCTLTHRVTMMMTARRTPSKNFLAL